MAARKSSNGSTYLQRRRRLLELVLELGGGQTARGPSKKAATVAIHTAMRRCGYKGTFAESQFTFTDRASGDAPMAAHIVAAIACFFAVHGKYDDGREWADTPDGCLQQVCNWLDFGDITAPEDASPAIFANRPKSVAEHLTRINPLLREPLTPDDHALLASLASGSVPLLLEAMKVAAGQIERILEESAPNEPEPEPEPLPCDPECAFVMALHLKKIVSAPPAEGESEALADATGIPLARVERLCCGDVPTAEELATITAKYELPPNYLPEMIKLIGASRLNANHDTESRGTVGNHKA